MKPRSLSCKSVFCGGEGLAFYRAFGGVEGTDSAEFVVVDLHELAVFLRDKRKVRGGVADKQPVYRAGASVFVVDVNHTAFLYCRNYHIFIVFLRIFHKRFFCSILFFRVVRISGRGGTPAFSGADFYA